MSTAYFYFEVEADLSGEMRPELIVQQLISEAGKQLFGECGAPQADVLKVSPRGNILLRVHAHQHRRLRAALALCPKTVRVCAEAPSLQALI
ncbi:unnamed protein product [Parnassius apollo]|uniref:(apollo) hypothetical protein n=1 Tax=Parnassius apollo TaxID=110799 RepID=A0A8S3VY53_PARAO|nr:unnamed protein product [Parnassius apollo]